MEAVNRKRQKIWALASALTWAMPFGANAGNPAESIPRAALLAHAPVEGAPSSPMRVPANATGMPRTEVEFGGTRESLTNGLPDWSSVYLEGVHTFKPRHALYGGLRDPRRFGQDDNEAYGGLYYPLSETWTGAVEGSASPTYNVLAKYSVG